MSEPQEHRVEPDQAQGLTVQLPHLPEHVGLLDPFAASSLPWQSTRASMMISLPFVRLHSTDETARHRATTGRL
jgi:hypothetical protein